MSAMPDIIDRLCAAVKSDETPSRALLVSAAAEIARLREAIRRLAEQDATLSVCNGNVIVEMDATPTLTDAEREAVEAAIKSLTDDPYDGAPISPHAATLRGLLDRIGHQ